MQSVLEADDRKAKSSDYVISLPMILSSLALTLSLGCVAYLTFHDPLEGGLRRYDLSTPKASLLSMAKMLDANDTRAMLAYQRAIGNAENHEKATTLEVHHEADWKGNKVLFVSFSKSGIKQHTTEALEKDANTGYWKPSYVSEYSLSQEKSDDATKLAKMMESWTKSGRLD